LAATENDDATEDESGTETVARARWQDSLAMLRVNFHAWWEGYELDFPDTAEDDAGEDGPSGWSATRFQVVEGLWGQGFSTPGEQQHILALIKPLGLDRKKRVLDINPGLGGTTRIIAKETGAWVVGLESNESLARNGMERSILASLADQAPIKLYRPPKLGIDAGTIDAVISKESLFTVADKAKLFQSIYDVLKPVGEFLFTDFLLAKGKIEDAGVKSWMAEEKPQPMPWTLKLMTTRLEKIGFDLRRSDDITDQLRRVVLLGWKQYVAGLKPDTLNEEGSAAMMEELELWTKRLALMEAGELRCHLFHATKSALKPR
jgi:cyclopropane fatty-acyl-phospholipid synthase-like methyltransferase